MGLRSFQFCELSGFFAFSQLWPEPLFHSRRFTFYKVTTVVGIQQNLFQLGDQRVARVSAGALVIEGVFRQLIDVSQKSAS